MVACSHYLPAGVASAWHPDGAVRDPFGIVENQVAAICRLTALVHFWHSGLCRCPRRQQEVGATDQIWIDVLTLQSLRICLQRFVVKDTFRDCIGQTSDARPVGKACDSTVRLGWSPNVGKQKQQRARDDMKIKE